MSLLTILEKLKGRKRKESQIQVVEQEIVATPEIPLVIAEPPSRFESFLKGLDIAIRVVANSPDIDQRLYWEVGNQAWRGKDPRDLLNSIISPKSKLPSQLTEIDNPLAIEFAHEVFRKLENYRGDFGYDIQKVGKNLTGEQREKFLETMNNGFSNYLNHRRKANKKEINKILRLYDKEKQGDNIPRLLKEARKSANAGNLKKTLDSLEDVERKATGDWTKEILEVYAQVYQTKFDSAIGKAEKAFAQERVGKGMQYLSMAEQYAREIGLRFKVNDSYSVGKCLAKRHFDKYAQTIEAYRNLSSVLRQVKEQKR